MGTCSGAAGEVEKFGGARMGTTRGRKVARGANTPATYTLRDDGDISVVNRCRKGSVDGPLDEAVGRSRFVDRVTFTKLEGSFFRPFWARVG